jgi:Leucine-rich repeat (LRR) protein
MDSLNSYLVISCKDYLIKDDNKLPNISAQYFKIVLGLTEWPYIPSCFRSSLYADFSNNFIESIGDLSNLASLEQLNVSKNLLTKIPNNFAQIKGLLSLDLSYNYIEVVDMVYFFCDFNSSTHIITQKYITSSLIFLNLKNNRIKIVNNFDLFIFGMFQLIQFDLRFNKIKQVNIGNISQYSKDLAQKAKILFTSDLIVNRIFTLFPYENYMLLLNDNQIEYVNFGLKALYEVLMEINANISVDYLFRRVSSALLTNNKIKCTCGLFDDLNFLVNGVFNTSTSQYFKSLGTSLIANTQCETKENEKINLISNLKAGNLSRSQFCDSSKAVDQIYGLNYFFLYFINVLTLWHSV